MFRSIANKSTSERSGVWSGEATRNINFGYEENTVTVTIDDESNTKETKPVKEQPVWMRESTVDKKSNSGFDKVRSMFHFFFFFFVRKHTADIFWIGLLLFRFSGFALTLWKWI